MRIAESRGPPGTGATTAALPCTAVTDEHRRIGMNGASEGPTHGPDDLPHRGHYTQGGRLKFFKDGKFILELERVKEGERAQWVSVPRKTYWPPQGNAASTLSYRQESSTSLSVSDDNSSVQSSPWQRDHSWKQSTPCRNRSKEMAFVWWARGVRATRRTRPAKGRRPYAPAQIEDGGGGAGGGGGGKTDEENVRSEGRARSKRVRPPLLAIVQNLTDRIQAAGSTPQRPEVVVSPRKRFLREMEKDRLQVEDACQKRSRSKAQGVATIPTLPPASKGSSPIRANGTVAAPGTTEDNVRNCKYSITSLLAPEERAPSRRSPNHSPSHYPSAQQQVKPYAAAEERWYSESVNRLQSMELSVDKRALSALSYHYMPSYYQYPYAVPPYFSTGMYGRRFVVPPIFPHQSLPTSTSDETPSCSWTTNPSKDEEHRDENITDMPLNLSKHAG